MNRTTIQSHKIIKEAPKGVKFQPNINGMQITIQPQLIRSPLIALAPIAMLIFVFYNFDFLHFISIENWYIGLFFVPFILFPILSVVTTFRAQIIEIQSKNLKLYYSIPHLFKRDRQFSLTNFEQFYTFKKVIDSHDSHHVSYEIHGILKEGAANILLIDNLPNAKMAYFIETQLESYLHIEDQAQLGEYDSRIDPESGFEEFLRKCKENILGR